MFKLRFNIAAANSNNNSGGGGGGCLNALNCVRARLFKKANRYGLTCQGVVCLNRASIVEDSKKNME
jgi:hypothetical protein